MLQGTKHQLERQLKADQVARQLRKRPSINELEEKGIIEGATCSHDSELLGVMTDRSVLVSGRARGRTRRRERARELKRRTLAARAVHARAQGRESHRRRQLDHGGREGATQRPHPERRREGRGGDRVLRAGPGHRGAARHALSRRKGLIALSTRERLRACAANRRCVTFHSLSWSAASTRSRRSGGRRDSLLRRRDSAFADRPCPPCARTRSLLLLRRRRRCSRTRALRRVRSRALR